MTLKPFNKKGEIKDVAKVQYSELKTVVNLYLLMVVYSGFESLPTNLLDR